MLRLVHLRSEFIPADDLLDRGERIGAAFPSCDECVTEARQQPDLAIDGTPIALQRGFLAPLDPPEHLPEQALEHQHRVVGERDPDF